MTIHTTEGMQIPDFVPTIEIEGGTVFLTCKEGDRLSIATTIERLIAMLDTMDGDENIESTNDEEPLLGWPSAGQRPTMGDDDDRELEESDSEPSLGAPEVRCVVGAYFYSERTLCPSVAPLGSQTSWAAGANDEREDDGDDLEPDHEGERSIGWLNEGSQANLSASDWGEPELGWPEQIDQISRLELKSGWFVHDGEPDLGWTGIATGYRGESMHDREGDDEREEDHAEHDGPGFLWGGGSEDGTMIDRDNHPY